jgi:hypothetical protein
MIDAYNADLKLVYDTYKDEQYEKWAKDGNPVKQEYIPNIRTSKRKEEKKEVAEKVPEGRPKKEITISGEVTDPKDRAALAAANEIINDPDSTQEKLKEAALTFRVLEMKYGPK